MKKPLRKLEKPVGKGAVPVADIKKAVKKVKGAKDVKNNNSV